MSMCSLDSSTSQPEGDYVNVDQVTKYVAACDISFLFRISTLILKNA